MAKQAVQELVNPRTNRLIRKNGATHRRWRKSNINAPDLEVVLTRDKQDKDVNQNAQETQSAEILNDQRSDEDSLSLASLRRANALGEEGMRKDRLAYVNDSKQQEWDPEAITNEVLHDHGVELLQAFQNSQVCFLDEVAQLLGIHTEQMRDA